MRNAPVLTRTISATLLALLLAVRLLAPAGFMPSFDGGIVTLIVCPDADTGAAPMSAHHDGHSKKLHQPCPYASASGLGALVLAAALLLGRTFLFLERHRTVERPPLRGPPIPA